MLIGLTWAEPSATPVTGWRSIEARGMPNSPLRLPGMPIAAAVSMIFSGPNCMPRVMSMNAVFTEFWVAWSMEMRAP